MTFDYDSRAQAARAAQEALHAAFRARPAQSGERVRGRHGQEARARAEQAWLDAARALRAAVADAYPPDFWTAYEQLRGGDRSGVPLAIGFLEADPWFFRSGYVKATLIRWLTRLPLHDDEVERLRRVVLVAVDSRDRREFRRYCRLARRVDGPALRATLQERLSSPRCGNTPAGAMGAQRAGAVTAAGGQGRSSSSRSWHVGCRTYRVKFRSARSLSDLHPREHRLNLRREEGAHRRRIEQRGVQIGRHMPVLIHATMAELYFQHSLLTVVSDRGKVCRPNGFTRHHHSPAAAPADTRSQSRFVPGRIYVGSVALGALLPPNFNAVRRCLMIEDRKIRAMTSSHDLSKADDMSSVIVRSDEILGGAPVFAGTRVPVRALLDYVGAGDRLDDFLADFPTVRREQAVRVLELAGTALLSQVAAPTRV